MENPATLDKLQGTVTTILEQYKQLKSDKASLEETVKELNARIIIQDKEISELSDDNAMKDLEIEEIITKIENILK